MENNLDKKIVVVDSEEKEHTLEVVFTYENEERGTKYVFFVDPEDENNVIVMRYKDDGDLEYIDDDEEYSEVEEVFNAYMEDPKIQEIK